MEVEVEGYLLTATASKKMLKLQCTVSATLADLVLYVIKSIPNALFFCSSSCLYFLLSQKFPCKCFWLIHLLIKTVNYCS